ncbi:MAG TPA: hypothetical protein PKB07_14140 [Flavilitoribacter sp.]|nr:hypothetical protein [Flavilitoribacter sp.]
MKLFEERYNTLLHWLWISGNGNLAKAAEKLKTSAPSLSRYRTVKENKGVFQPLRAKEKESEGRNRLVFAMEELLNYTFDQDAVGYKDREGHLIQIKYRNGSIAKDQQGEVMLLVRPNTPLAAQSLSDLNLEGVRRVHLRVTDSILENLFNRAKREIRVLTTYSSHLEKLKDCLQNAINRDCRIKILMLHPTSEAAQLRQKGIYVLDNSIDIAKEISKNIVIFKELQKSARGNLEWRFFNEVPGLQLFAVDDIMLCGWFFYGEKSDEKPFVEVTLSNPIGQTVNKHWDNLWNNNGDNWKNTTVNRCFFVLDNKIDKFILEINNYNHNVRIRSTHSKDTYSGSIYYFNNHCTIRVGTDFSERHRKDRLGTFTLHCSNKILNEDLTIGVFTNLDPLDNPYSTLMVLQKTDKAGDEAFEVPEVIRNFLLSNERSAYFEADKSAIRVLIRGLDELKKPS